MSETNRTDIGLIPEVTFGATPSAPIQWLRRTGGSITPTQGTVRSQEIRSDLLPGAAVRTMQMASGEIGVEWSAGTLDEILSGLLMSDWASGSGGDTIVPGTTKKSYTFVERFAGVTPNIVKTYRGARIGSLSMSLALDSIVSGAFGVTAAVPSFGSTLPGSGTSAALTTGVWNTIDMVETLEEQGSELGQGVVGVEINLTRDLRELRDIREINPFDIGVGRLQASGSITQHFRSVTLAEAWADFGNRTLEVAFDDGEGNEFGLTFHRIKYVGDLSIDIPGPDADCIVTVNWEAEVHPTDGFLTARRVD